jgi:hypothetical protein
MVWERRYRLFAAYGVGEGREIRKYHWKSSFGRSTHPRRSAVLELAFRLASMADSPVCHRPAVHSTPPQV